MSDHDKWLDSVKAHTNTLQECQRLEAEAARLREALQFYAGGLHMILHDSDTWDTVSGEPQNWWCDEAGTATIEDGHIAKLVLAGHTMRWDAQGELTLEPPTPVPNSGVPHE